MASSEFHICDLLKTVDTLLMGNATNLASNALPVILELQTGGHSCEFMIIGHIINVVPMECWDEVEQCKFNLADAT